MIRARIASAWSIGKLASSASTRSSPPIRSIRSTASSSSTITPIPSLRRARSSTRPRSQARRNLFESDPEQPRRGRTARGIEAPHAHERGGERLRGEIGGQLRLAGAPHEEPQQQSLVAAVELGERLRTRRREGE